MSQGDHPVSPYDNPASQRNHRHVARRSSPCRNATTRRRNAITTVSECDQPRVGIRSPARRDAIIPRRNAITPASECDQPRAGMRRPLVRKRSPPRRNAISPASECGHPTSESDRPLVGKRSAPRRNATPSRRNAIAPASECDQPGVGMRSPPRRNAITPAPNAVTPASGMRRPSSECDHLRLEMRSPPRRNAITPALECDAPCSNAARSVVVTVRPRWALRTARVPTRHPRCAGACAFACNVTNRCLLALPLDISTQQTYSYRHKVEDRKVSGFGGCRRYGRAGKHIRPVPARELSYLLLPRALEVCTHFGKTSTGGLGA